MTGKICLKAGGEETYTLWVVVFISIASVIVGEGMASF
jgi:hypothetical protein